MENEGVFQADAEINGLEHMYSRSSHPSENKRPDTHKVMLGRHIPDEESPLLSSNREDEDEEGSEHGAGETRGPPQWDGDGDFEGRPWWNKPSVRVSDPNTKIAEIDPLSCSGSFLRTSSLQWHSVAPSSRGST